MTTLREAALMALEALENFNRTSSEAYLYGFQIEIAALRSALEAESRAKPVAWMDSEGDVYPMPEKAGWCPPHTLLYTAPPPRKPLTDEEIATLMADIWGSASISPQSAPAFARAIERAHGIWGEV